MCVSGFLTHTAPTPSRHVVSCHATGLFVQQIGIRTASAVKAVTAVTADADAGLNAIEPFL